MPKELSPEELIQQCYVIVQREINLILKGQHINCIPKEAADIVNDYMRTLIQLKKENRFAEVGEDLELLDDAEFTKVKKEFMKSMEEPQFNKTNSK